MQHKLEIGPYKCQPVSRFDILCNEYNLEAKCVLLHVNISTKYESMKILPTKQWIQILAEAAGNSKVVPSFLDTGKI